MPTRWFALVTLPLFLAACGGGGPSTAQKAEAAPQQTASPQAAQPSPDERAIEKMKAKLLGEPSVRDLVYDGAGAVQWQIGVKDDGSPRYGLAEYVCMELTDAGLVSSKTNVRIVDVDRLASSNGDFRGASLGRVACATGERSAI